MSETAGADLTADGLQASVCDVSGALCCAVAQHADGTCTLTVFEDDAACSVDLSAGQAALVADLLATGRGR